VLDDRDPAPGTSQMQGQQIAARPALEPDEIIVFGHGLITGGGGRRVGRPGSYQVTRIQPVRGNR
jgi:hypothetical protein